MTMALTALLIAGYFAVLGWALRHRGQPLTGRGWFLWRCFFPNWQFYAHLGVSPRLWVRAADPSAARDQHWQLVYPHAPRAWHQLFVNPSINLALYQQNLLDHLIADLQQVSEPQAIVGLTSYQLVQRYAAVAWQGIPPSEPQPSHLQFCITQHPNGSAVCFANDMVLLSQPLPRLEPAHD